MRKNAVIAVGLLNVLLAGSASGADYYVSTAGSDTNSGTLAEPFATIQHAVDQMNPGDTCYIRGGTYRETVDLSGVAGTSGNPITLTAYQDEEVILDGTIPITSNWTQHSGNIYKTTLSEDIWQLFVDGEMMTLARFPNAKTFSDLMWDREAARRFKKDNGSSNGHVVDDPDKGAAETLAGAGVSFEGCVGVLNFGNYSTSARMVTKHVVGTDHFDYAPEVDEFRQTDGYFFEGGTNGAELVMLDSAGEWAYDESTKALYLWADDGLTPQGRSIAGKVKSYVVTGDAATRHVVLNGLDFFGTAFHFESSDYITLQNCALNYYSYSKRALGSTAWADPAYFDGSSADPCVGCVVYNCEFSYSSGTGLACYYVETMTVENNLFYQNSYANANRGSVQTYTVDVRPAQGFDFRRNTIDHSGCGQTVRLGRWVNSGVVVPWVVEYNVLMACGLQQTDGAAVYSPGPSIVESVIRYNWAIGNGARDYRWDGKNDPLTGIHANLYRNVSMDTGLKTVHINGDGYRLKGDLNEIYNNLGVNERSTLNVALDKGGNANTFTRNNAADIITDNPIPGTASNNYDGENEVKTMRQLLRDIDNFDFRPRSDATELIDQGTAVTCSVDGQNIDVTAGYLGGAPDIGAYEFGDPVYWIPGRQLPQASMAVPPDEGTSVRCDADLMYLIGLDGVSANIYFGSDSNSLTFLASQTNPTNVVDLGSHAVELGGGNPYYWRVDTVLADSSVVTGEVWSFTTEMDFAYWRFENNLADSGINGFDLTANGAATLAPLPLSGAGIDIPSTVPLTGVENTSLGDLGDENSYYGHADDSWFDFGSNNVSLEAFITAGTDGTSGQVIFEKQSSMIFQVSTADSEMRLGIKDVSFNNVAFSPAGGIETGKDYYVAAVVEPGALNGGADTRVTLYCKNLTDATPLRKSGALTIAGISAFLNTPDDLFVGGRNVDARKAVKHIDEARITKRALSEGELLYPVQFIDPVAMSLILMDPDTTTNGPLNLFFSTGMASNAVEILSLTADAGFSAVISGTTLNAGNPLETITVTYTNTGALVFSGDTTNSTLEVEWMADGSGVTNLTEVPLDVVLSRFELVGLAVDRSMSTPNDRLRVAFAANADSVELAVLDASDTKLDFTAYDEHYAAGVRAIYTTKTPGVSELTSAGDDFTDSGFFSYITNWTQNIPVDNSGAASTVIELADLVNPDWVWKDDSAETVVFIDLASISEIADIDADVVLTIEVTAKSGASTAVEEIDVTIKPDGAVSYTFVANGNSYGETNGIEIGSSDGGSGNQFTGNARHQLQSLGFSADQNASGQVDDKVFGMFFDTDASGSFLLDNILLNMSTDTAPVIPTGALLKLELWKINTPLGSLTTTDVATTFPDPELVFTGTGVFPGTYNDDDLYMIDLPDITLTNDARYGWSLRWNTAAPANLVIGVDRGPGNVGGSFAGNHLRYNNIGSAFPFYGVTDGEGPGGWDIVFFLNAADLETFADWAAGHGLTGTDTDRDADPENGGLGDGYNNLVEFALGMDPTIADAGSEESIGTAAEGGTNYFEYVHNRRADYAAQGLSYLLLDKTNLITSVVGTNTQDQILIGVASASYEPVTNRYVIDEPVKFIELKVRQE